MDVGWTSLRPDDLGRLWEHYVLNELTAHLQSAGLRYWRNKQGHEVDFLWLPRGKAPMAIECKWTARDFDPGNLLVFARAYPKATLLVVATDARPSFSREYGRARIEFLGINELIARIASQ